ncbi:hypothetical protein BU204_26525 [Actinophytocola xanthii]|uniref:TNT domain-containing protein n=2 Tax=Actinophytocola xanthii TaxID=1912961 RepID=A0A1Q8CGT3_9PSEU|nr:hypothetical protein BU204_26525 [Actinophytocola xanthii]
MLRVAPDNWEQLTVDYRAVGRYSEATGRVVYADGGSEAWTMPPDLQGLFARLRGGMYRDGRGTWFNARYRLDHPSSYNLEYDREEPAWEKPPPPQAYPDDMRLFPRTEDNVPEWLRRRLAAAPAPRFRVARIFDGPGDGGRPSVNRPPLSPADAADVLAYLDNAPLVGPVRGYDVDRLDPEGRPAVPVAFHTDGTWIWPAAVNYYLREHEVPPEPELVDHIARSHFQVPPVDEPTRAAAAAFLGGGAPPPPRVPPAPATRAMPVPPTAAMPVPPPPGQPAPPPAALPSSGPPGRIVETLRARLNDLGIPPTAYRIGPPAGRAWTMDQTEDGWRVGWFDREFVAPAMFEDVADASAFLLGKLLLDADRWQAAGMPVAPAPVPPAPANPADFALASDPAEAFVPPGQRSPGLEETQFTPGLAETPEPDPMPTYQLTAPNGGARIDSPVAPAAFNGRPEREAGFPRRGGSRPDSPFPDEGFEPRNGRPADSRPEVELGHPAPDAGFPRRESASAEGGFARPGGGPDTAFAGPGEGGFARPDAPADPGFARHDGSDAAYGTPGEGRDGEFRRPGGPSTAFGGPDVGYGRTDGSDTPFGGPSEGRDGGFRRPGGGPDSPPARRGEAPGAGYGRPDSPFGRPGGSSDDGAHPSFAPHGDAPDPAFGRPGEGEFRRPAGGPDTDRPAAGRRAAAPEGGFEPRHDRTNGVHGARPAFTPGDHPDPGFDGTNGRHGDQPDPALDRPEGRRAARHEPTFEEEPGLGRRAARQDADVAPDSSPADAGFVPRSERHRADSPGPSFTPPKPAPAPTLVAPAARPPAAAPPNQEWPITPMQGEPPLTLFRGKRMVELEPGTEFDRFGEDDGNLVYALGTPFQERSLVPDWVERPYHAYRVRQPVQVLIGTAIPWFDQPGGGTAYLLPDSVGELLAGGQIAEISGRERPPA